MREGVFIIMSTLNSNENNRVDVRDKDNKGRVNATVMLERGHAAERASPLASDHRDGLPLHNNTRLNRTCLSLLLLFDTYG